MTPRNTTDAFDVRELTPLLDTPRPIPLGQDDPLWPRSEMVLRLLYEARSWCCMKAPHMGNNT